ncbi:MAG TPA: hypothetical protein VJT33_10675 [bacterium]|nr:hypothetical protein [bacterium]
MLHLLPGPGGRSYAQAGVDVHLRLDGTVAVYYHGQPLTAHVDPATSSRIPAYTARNAKSRPSADASTSTGPVPWRLITRGDSTPTPLGEKSYEPYE